MLASLRRLAREYGLPEDAAVDEMRIMDAAFTEAIWRERNRRSGRLGASLAAAETPPSAVLCVAGREPAVHRPGAAHPSGQGQPAESAPSRIKTAGRTPEADTCPSRSHHDHPPH